MIGWNLYFTNCELFWPSPLKVGIVSHISQTRKMRPGVWKSKVIGLTIISAEMQICWTFIQLKPKSFPQFLSWSFQLPVSPIPSGREETCVLRAQNSVYMDCGLCHACLLDEDVLNGPVVVSSWNSPWNNEGYCLFLCRFGESSFILAGPPSYLRF